MLDYICITTRHVEHLQLKNCSRMKSMISVTVLKEKHLQNDLSVIFVCEDSKQLVFCLYGAIFQFYAEKSPKNAENVDVSALCI